MVKSIKVMRDGALVGTALQGGMFVAAEGTEIKNPLFDGRPFEEIVQVASKRITSKNPSGASVQDRYTFIIE